MVRRCQPSANHPRAGRVQCHGRLSLDAFPPHSNKPRKTGLVSILTTNNCAESDNLQINWQSCEIRRFIHNSLVERSVCDATPRDSGERSGGCLVGHVGHSGGWRWVLRPDCRGDERQLAGTVAHLRSTGGGRDPALVVVAGSTASHSSGRSVELAAASNQNPTAGEDRPVQADGTDDGPSRWPPLGRVGAGTQGGNQHLGPLRKAP